MQSGQAGADMMRRLTSLGIGGARADDVRRLDRLASRRASCRRRRRGRRASSATSSSRSGTGPIRRRTCTTRSRPTGAIRTVNANGLIYGSLELSADYLPVLDPVHNTISRVPLTVRDPTTPMTSPAMPAAVAVLGRRADLDEQEQRPQPDDRREGTRVDHVGGPAAGRIPDFCKAGSSHPSAKLFPLDAARRGSSRCTTRRRRSSTHIDTCFSTHHLMFAEDANNTLWTSGGGQVVGWLNTKMFDETATRRSRRAGRRSSSTPTATASATRTSSRTSRSIRRRTSAIDGGALRRRAGARRLDLGLGARLPRRGRPPVAGRESAGDRARRSLRAAVQQSEPTRASRRAAWTSIATASSGRRWPAATWRASIAASARAR